MVITIKRLNQDNSFFSKYITYSNCLVLSFFVLSFIGILNHEMWRDETQAWLIAKDASTLTDLYENLKFEGHPGLWHLCLFLITKFTHNPFAMQFFHILISTAIVYLFVKVSPFNIVQKTLFTFSYFPLFEYNLISRNYNLGLLLIFLFCYLFTRKSRNYICLFSVLALLANTNVYSLIICLCLSATLMIDIFKTYRANNKKLNRKQVKNIIIGLLILFLGVGLCIFQLLPVALQDTGYNIQQNTEKEVISKFDYILTRLKDLAYVFRGIWYSYIPIPNFFKYHFWSNNIMTISDSMSFFVMFMSLYLFAFAIFIFIDKPIVLFLYLSATLGIFLFSWLKFLGTLRHHGHLFIILLTCIWISNFFDKSYNIPKTLQKLSNSFKKHQKKIITLILLIQMFSGLYAYSMDLIYPFSQSKAAAQFIQQKGLSEEFILGNKDAKVSPISAYIDKKIFYIEYNRLGSFFQNPQKKIIKNQSELIDRINNIIKNNSKKNVLILSYPLNVKSNLLNITPIGEFSKSIVAEEQYYIYLVEKNKV
jgi:hypothetical protein